MTLDLQRNQIALACAHMESDLPAALECLESALDLASKTAFLSRDHDLLGLLKSTMGQCYLTHGDEEKAIDWFKKAVADDPQVEPARQNLVALLMKRKRWDELMEFAEVQTKVFGEQPDLLYVLGRAQFGSGHFVRATKTLHRAKSLPEKLAKWIDEYLDLAINQSPKSEEPFSVAAAVSPHVTREQFERAAASFGEFVKAERRMSFWRIEDKKRKLVANPEQHAKVLLYSFLRGRLGDNVTILDEVVSGPGSSICGSRYLAGHGS